MKGRADALYRKAKITMIVQSFVLFGPRSTVFKEWV